MVVDYPGQLVGGGRDGFESTEAGAHSKEALPGERLGPVKALSSHSESQRRTVFRGCASPKAHPRRKCGLVENV